MSSPKPKSPKSRGSNKALRRSKSGNEVKDELVVEKEEALVNAPPSVMHRRMRFLLETQLKVDVEFLVGPKDTFVSIKAHKCMLAAESSVFDNLFAMCDQWKLQQNALKGDANSVKVEEGQPKEDKKAKSPKKAGRESRDKSPKKSNENVKVNSKSKSVTDKPEVSNNKEKSINFYKDEVVGDNVIRVQDVYPTGFHQLLSYIYYDEITFKSVVGAIQTMYAARKYCFYDLCRICVSYMENNVCLDHVLKLFQAGLDFNLDRLKQLCLRLVINETRDVLSRAEFKNVSSELLEQILLQDMLNISEFELFDHVMQWAENKCELIGFKVNAPNQRIALGTIKFALIRFPTMVPHEFATHVVDSGILRPNEIIAILQYFITGQKLSLDYSCKARRRPIIDSSPLDNVSITCSDKTDVTFIVNSGYPIRSYSFNDLYVFDRDIQPTKTLLIKERQHTGSPPARFHVDDDEFDGIEFNIQHLKKMHKERAQFK